MENEIWKSIPNYKELYEASDKGRIRSLRSGRILKVNPKEKYYRVRLWKNKVGIKYGVHRLVYFAFYGERPVDVLVRHLDGDKKNNQIKNLREGTYSENSRDRRIHEEQLISKIKDDPQIESTAKQIEKLCVKYDTTPATLVKSITLLEHARQDGIPI